MILGNVCVPGAVRQSLQQLVAGGSGWSSPANSGRLKRVAGVFVADQQWSHHDLRDGAGCSAAFQSIYG